MPYISGGGGAGVKPGTLVPVADASGVTVDTTTYPNTVTGSGKIATLMIGDTVAIAFATHGDAFPRLLILGDPTDGFAWFGDGTFDAYASGASIGVSGHTMSFEQVAVINGVNGHATTSNAPAVLGAEVVRLGQVSSYGSITSGALSTFQLVSGTATQNPNVQDIETHTTVTTDHTNNVATCTVAISPDNTTFSTLSVWSQAAALNNVGAEAWDVAVRLPNSWYLKLTAVHATLGVTTFY